jgi:hypothetical protein
MQVVLCGGNVTTGVKDVKEHEIAGTNADLYYQVVSSQAPSAKYEIIRQSLSDAIAWAPSLSVP